MLHCEDRIHLITLALRFLLSRTCKSTISWDFFSYPFLYFIPIASCSTIAFPTYTPTHNAVQHYHIIFLNNATMSTLYRPLPDTLFERFTYWVDTHPFTIIIMGIITALLAYTNILPFCFAPDVRTVLMQHQAVRDRYEAQLLARKRQWAEQCGISNTLGYNEYGESISIYPPAKRLPCANYPPLGTEITFEQQMWLDRETQRLRDEEEDRLWEEEVRVARWRRQEWAHKHYMTNLRGVEYVGSYIPPTH